MPELIQHSDGNTPPRRCPLYTRRSEQGRGDVLPRQSNEFYVWRGVFSAPHITALGYDFMPFNRRGHDSVSTYDSREVCWRRLSNRRRRHRR